MSEVPLSDSRDSADRKEDEIVNATALGLAAVNFFRLFLVSVLREGLLPGFTLTPVGSSAGDGCTGSATDRAAIAQKSQEFCGQLLSRPVIVPNYCTDLSYKGPFYLVTRGPRVGIYNSPTDALQGSAGVEGASVTVYLTERAARDSFVDAWTRGEVVETSNSIIAPSHSSQTIHNFAADNNKECTSPSFRGSETHHNSIPGSSGSAPADDDKSSDTEGTDTMDCEHTEASFWATQGSSSYVEAQLNSESSIEI